MRARRGVRGERGKKRKASKGASTQGDWRRISRVIVDGRDQNPDSDKRAGAGANNTHSIDDGHIYEFKRL